MKKSEKLLELRTNVLKLIDSYNVAVSNGDFDSMNDIESDLKEAEMDYTEVKTAEVFEELSNEEKPIKAAIIKYSYTILSHKANREEGRVIGIELNEKEKQIDLVKLAKFCKIKATWDNMVQKFNQLLCLRAARELKMTQSQINEISKSYYMADAARKIELGETPDSNTQICKMLQKIIDEMVFEDNGKGKNTLRVNNHDVAYLLMCYTKKGKSALTVATSRHSIVHALVMDIAHRVLLNKKYGIEYKASKDESTYAKAAGEETTRKATEKELESAKKAAEKATKKVSEKSAAKAEESTESVTEVSKNAEVSEKVDETVTK